MQALQGMLQGTLSYMCTRSLCNGWAACHGVCDASPGRVQAREHDATLVPPQGADTLQPEPEPELAEAEHVHLNLSSPVSAMP